MHLTLANLQKIAAGGEKLAMLTAYDASFAALVEAAGVEIILVGDSLGMVVQGHSTTLPVSLDEMEYHTRCVARGCAKPLIVADLPFGAYQASAEQAFHASARLMAAGAGMVKLEGGALMAPTVEFLVARGIPVCGHIGLTPQSVHALGGFRVQGKGEAAAARLRDDAKALAAAGAGMIVMEAMPAGLAKTVTEECGALTIGIGAGPDCSGQVLVLHDMLDVWPGKKARFVKNFMAGADSVAGAVAAYVTEVKAGTFPGPEHSF